MQIIVHTTCKFIFNKMSRLSHINNWIYTAEVIGNLHFPLALADIPKFPIMISQQILGIINYKFESQNFVFQLMNEIWFDFNEFPVRVLLLIKLIILDPVYWQK